MVVTTINNMNEVILGEIFSYFPLTDLDTSIRQVSKLFHHGCNEQKKRHWNYLNLLLQVQQQRPSANNKFVQIVNLQSAKGKLLNDKLGKVMKKVGGTSTSTSTKSIEGPARFQIQLIDDITGEKSNVLVKAQNLNIYTPKSLVEEQNHALNFVNYIKETNISRVRDEHGMLLEDCLTRARWYSNIISGMTYFQGSFEEFMQLTGNSRALVEASSTMFSFWDIPPNQHGRHGHGDLSILDMSVLDLMKNEAYIAQTLGKGADWPADGRNGELIVRNYVRFLQSWKTERISGRFMVTNVFKTGSIMVKISEDFELGSVYLVKGQASVIGELFSHGLPSTCHTTILPMYDFLVYDGICMRVPQLPIDYGSFLPRLKAHVQKALDQRTVITRGKSSAQGLWNSDPPPLPLVINDGKALDWSNTGYETWNESVKDRDSRNGPGVIEFSERQKKKAMQIAKLTKRKGVLNDHVNHGTMCNTFVFRRYGYTVEENPERGCILLFNQEAYDMFQFSDGLTYNLDEVLDQLLGFVKQIAMPPIIMPDEFSVVEPLNKILKESLEAVGVDDEVKILYYPPPTEEEERFAAMSMY